MKQDKTVSFCTTCANRLYQLKGTFAANLKVIAEHANTEWVIVNFASQDNIDKFMSIRLPRLPRRIVYFKDLSHKEWHLSVAKNVAHKLASGDILVNLDCDNFIGDALGPILRCFLNNADIVHLWSGVYRDGSCGRIAIARDVFLAVGGYDESFLPMGYQDLDLLNRARAAGYNVVRLPRASGAAIQNSKDQSIESCAIRSSWRQFNSLNRKRSNSNIEAGLLVANLGRDWGSANVKIARGRART